MGSFLDFVQSQGATPFKNARVEPDILSLSSGDTGGYKSESSSIGQGSNADSVSKQGKSLNVARRGKGTARRGRGGGRGSSFSTTKPKRSQVDSDESGSESVIDYELEEPLVAEVELEPPAVPRRVRSQRKAKQRASRFTGQGSGKRRSSARSGSDSEQSLTEEESDKRLEPKEDADDGVGYDSDKDPAWRPSKIKQYSSKKRKSRDDSSGSDDGHPASHHTGSASRGRGRGRGTASSTSDMPALTPMVTLVPTAAKQPVVPLTITPARVATPTVMPIHRGPGRPPTCGAALSNPNLLTSPQTMPDVIPQQSSVLAASSKDASTQSNPPPAIFLSDLYPPHNFQKGEFVFDRRDAQNFTTHPIWKIDSQRLLQKFEAFEQDGRLLHRALCTYSSWPGRAQHNYTGIAIRYLSSARGKEVVEVQEKYKPRPLGVRGDELESLREAFVIYVQTLVSQALEPSFVGALQQEPDPYYINAMTLVDSLLQKRKLAVQGIFNWTQEFLDVLNKFPSYTLSDVSDSSKVHSQATDNRTGFATKRIRLFGFTYNYDTLEQGDEVAENNATEFVLTQTESLVVSILHGLQHFKFNLCQSCVTQVDALKAATADIDDHDVLDNCLRNQLWMQQVFAQLTVLIENADRITGH
jgi:hypothetical protein